MNPSTHSMAVSSSCPVWFRLAFLRVLDW
jgi:hypothetical protein